MPLNKAELAKQAKRLDIFEFREGVNLLRVLPPDLKYFTEDIGYICFKYITHWGLGPEGSPPLTCPRSFGETARCPICEKVRALKNNPAYKEFVSSIYPSKRHIFNIIDVEHPEKGIQVMETGPTIFDGIFKFAVDAEYGDVLDLEKGRNFKITLTPGSKHKSGFNRYEVLASANPSSIKDKLPEDWKVTVAALEGNIRQALSYEELAAFLDGSAESTQTEATPPTSAKVTGAAPLEPSSTPAPSEEKKPAEEAPPPPAAEESKECFGLEYTPSSERCKACERKPACVQEYVRT